MTRIELDDDENNEMWISAKDGIKYEAAKKAEQRQKEEDFEEWSNYQGE